MINLFELTVDKLGVDIKKYSRGELTMLKQAIINGQRQR